MASLDEIPAKFNTRNPAVKRIMQEIKEMQSDSSREFIAQALEDDIFEWDFVIRGPPDTEFEGGIYHGRILLPPEYPFKPPGFMMLTPNGRFETGVKICLSISSHHPEHWQPSWSVRTALTAMIAFMPSPGQGALGSLDYSKEERKSLALKSRAEVPKFGSAERQKVLEELHNRMMDLQEESGSAKEVACADSTVPDSETGGLKPLPAIATSVSAAAASANSLPGTPVAAREPQTPVSARVNPASPMRRSPQLVSPNLQQPPPSDKGLTLLAVALAFGILAILLKKAWTVWGVLDTQVMGSPGY